MLEPYVRIQNALDRSGISLRKLAALAGVCNHTMLSKYLRRVQWDLTDARHVAEVAEQIANLVEAGQAHASDSVEQLQSALEADRANVAASFDALYLLGR